MSNPHWPGCGRAPSPKDIRIDAAGFDPVEQTILEISRYYCQSFAHPETQSWMHALTVADQRFAAPFGAEIGLAVLAAVQAMRTSRRSCFDFNNPRCPGCAIYVSEHERQFISLLKAARGSHLGRAQTHAMLLCEGNNTDILLSRMCDLSRKIDSHRLASPKPLGTSIGT